MRRMMMTNVMVVGGLGSCNDLRASPALPPRLTYTHLDQLHQPGGVGLVGSMPDCQVERLQAGAGKGGGREVVGGAGARASCSHSNEAQLLQLVVQPAVVQGSKGAARQSGVGVRRGEGGGSVFFC